MTKQENEDAVVARIERKLAFPKSKLLAMGVGDDAAMWRAKPGYEIVLTCDWFLERSHFLREKHPADAVGWKSLARAASDIAAMGGTPRCFLLSLALPADLTGRWLDDFLRGLKRASRALRCEAAGGDTTRQDRVLISITVIGEVRRHGAILRSGANAGDLIYVSGVLGEAELGLRQFRRQRGLADASNVAIRKHLYPKPRLALGEWLAENRVATAMMDLSDGLSTDLPRMCAASGVGATIQVESLPVTRLVPVADARELALHGGDDYELLFTVSARKARRVPQRFRGLPLTCIGKMIREPKIVVETERGSEP